MNLFCSANCSHKLGWLFLDKNNLTYLQDNTFKGLPKLTHLFVNGNNIHSLGGNVFVGTGIEHIFMFSNKLNSLTNKSFSSISSSVRKIHVYKNNITIISDDVLPATMNMLTLYVDCGKLDELPKLPQNITISCVKDTVLPDIKITGKYVNSIKATLTGDAFECTASMGKPNCHPCPSGTFGDRDKGCSPCPAGGYYQDEIGSTQCKKCKDGTFARQSGSKSSENCEVCPEGTNFTLFAGHRACFCKMDYARIDRYKGCSLCYKPGVNCSNDYQSIRFGYYWNWSFQGANITAYTSFVSLIQNDSLDYNESNSRYVDKIPKVHRCPRRESCKNEGSFRPDAIEGKCEEGYRGWLCSKCKSKYYSLLHFCMRCPDPVWIVLETVVTLLLAFGLYILVKRQDNFAKKRRKEHRTLVDKISSQMKIALGFYQVVGELFESFRDVNWVGPLQFMGQLISFLKVNILRFVVQPHCLNEKFRVDVKLQMIISLIFPIAMGSFFIALYYVWKLILKCRLRYRVTGQKVTLENLKDRLLTYALLLLFITYPPTCDVIFKLYPGACKTFHLFEHNDSVNITLLRADYDIDCTTLQKYHFLAYVSTIAYVLAFPCALFFLLRKYCKRNLMESLVEVSQVGNSVSENVCLVQGKRKTFGKIPVWMKFLCENYKPEFWYWEIVELARKVTQTILVTLLGWEDALTKLLTISISVLFLTLHAKLAPMTNRFEQRLQMFSLAAIFINVLVASVPIPETYQATISTVLIMLNMIIIVIIVGEVALITFRFIKKRYFGGALLMQRGSFCQSFPF
ncbi:Reticulon-4 receptor-like 1 [Holothuria leucospilota]|uniref:Reticulon-4 receptor-like 1 n=1 Tax=Holothuria leucospilota TaxID=206669 RepID=A0A9Q0YLD1_HOLLE|nr:Reticulon-4 receptor-like 1 [Holothuria leucospilota]